MGRRIPGIRTSKRLVIFLLVLVTSINLFSYDMQILPDTLISGRVITLKILTDIEEKDSLEVSDIELPENLILISGPTIRAYYGKINGRNKRLYQVNWAVRSREPGVYEIPEVTITAGSSEYKIDKKLIKVFNTDETDNNYPLIVNWKEGIKKEIYVGESLPIVAEAYNLEEIVFPDRVYLTEPRKGEVVEVSGLGDITPEKIGEDNLYRVPVSSWIYTSFEAGEVTIPSVRVDINGFRRYTDPLTINVLPLPEVNATGGVGEFLITSEMSTSQVTPEDQFHFKIKISGQGNIPYIKFPEVEYPGLILIDKTENKWIEYGESGFIGWREQDYTLQALEPGVKEISVSEVSWINKDGSDVFFNGSISHINVVSVKVVEEDILPFLSFYKTPEIIKTYRFFWYKTPLAWLLLLFSSLILLLIKAISKLTKGKGKKVLLMSLVSIPLLLSTSIFVKGFEFQGDLVRADNYIDNGDYIEALEVYDQLEDELSYNYGLYVNRAILWDKLGNLSQAVYNIRIAERISAGNTKIKDIKNYFSKSDESRLKQAKTASSVNPDILFLVLVVLFNVSIIVLIAVFRNRNISNFTLFFACVTFTLLAGISLAFVHSRNSVPSGVISSGGAELTKVPNKNALNWITLEEGNSVYIEGEWMNQYLIETEYGLQGWVNKDSLLVLEER